MNHEKKINNLNIFINLYRKRLHIPSEFNLTPNLSTLRYLSERHLEYIPFENIVLHTSEYNHRNNNNDDYKHKNSSSEKQEQQQQQQQSLSPINLSKESLIHKILISSYGGCCLELNGLFSMFLTEIGYSNVVLVPCYVFAGKERGHRNKKGKFRVTASHFVILVTIDEKYMLEDEDNDDNNDLFVCTYENSNSFIIDVGLGEPSLWPLEYVLDKVQITPEKMKSRMVWDKPWVDRQGQTRQCIVLEWFVGGDYSENKNNGWEPRLQWDINDAPLKLSDKYDNSLIRPRTDTLTLDSFQSVIPLLLNPKSNFAKKLVVCKLLRDKKVTLAGRVLKITSPRFGSSKQKITRDLETDEEVYNVLRREFGIILNDDVELCLPTLEYSKVSKLWDHL